MGLGSEISTPSLSNHSFLNFSLSIQFSMLAERLALERQEIQVRKKAQEKVSNTLPKTSLLISIKYPALEMSIFKKQVDLHG